jgi:TRAP-type C4-dicarboxylate transport system permease small subunit
VITGKKVFSKLDSIIDIFTRVVGWLVLAMMVIILVEIFMRYVLGQPIIIAEELCGYLLVAISYLGMAYTWKEKGHVRITALVSRLPARVSNWLRLVTLIFALLFTIVIISSSYSYLAHSFKVHMVSSTYYRIPLQGPQMTILIGFVLFALLIVVDIIRAILQIRSGARIED